MKGYKKQVLLVLLLSVFCVGKAEASSEGSMPNIEEERGISPSRGKKCRKRQNEEEMFPTKVKILRFSAENQYELGTVYYEGEEASQDYEKAFIWWTRAAKQEYAQAQYKVGVLYERGEGTVRDIGKALKWYKKAAKQGVEEAKKRLFILENKL